MVVDKTGVRIIATDEGLNPLPIFVSSLKDPVSVAVIEDLLSRVDVFSDEDFPLGCVINMTAFATSKPGASKPTPTPFQSRGHGVREFLNVQRRPAGGIGGPARVGQVRSVEGLLKSGKRREFAAHQGS